MLPGVVDTGVAVRPLRGISGESGSTNACYGTSDVARSVAALGRCALYLGHRFARGGTHDEQRKPRSHVRGWLLPSTDSGSVLEP